jgi:hypothetical protein
MPAFVLVLVANAVLIVLAMRSLMPARDGADTEPGPAPRAERSETTKAPANRQEQARSAPSALSEEAISVSVGSASAFALPIDDRTVTIAVAGPPRSHPAAIAAHHMSIWIDWGGSGPDLVAEQAIEADPFVWSGTFAKTTVPVAVHLAVIDPLGRMGLPTRKEI